MLLFYISLNDIDKKQKQLNFCIKNRKQKISINYGPDTPRIFSILKRL